MITKIIWLGPTIFYEKNDSNTQELMKKQLYPSGFSNFLPYTEESCKYFWLLHRHLHVFLTFIMQKINVTLSNVKEKWTMGSLTS